MQTRIQTEFNSNAQNGTNRSHALLTCKSSNRDKASTEQSREPLKLTLLLSPAIAAPYGK